MCILARHQQHVGRDDSNHTWAIFGPRLISWGEGQRGLEDTKGKCVIQLEPDAANKLGHLQASDRILQNQLQQKTDWPLSGMQKQTEFTGFKVKWQYNFTASECHSLFIVFRAIIIYYSFTLLWYIDSQQRCFSWQNKKTNHHVHAYLTTKLSAGRQA